MSRLKDLFSDLRRNKRRYLNSAKGGEFEDRIDAKLYKLGYSRIIKDDIEGDGFKLLKTQVQNKETNHKIRNPLKKFKKHFLTQPYGSQDYPDFLVLDGSRVISIEVKFSRGRQGRPVWNSGLPRPNGIYIYGAYERSDVTFFVGGDVVSKSDVKKLHDFFDKGLKEYQMRFNEDEMGEQEYGFAAYIRKAFEQTKKYNPDAKIDFFSNENRKALEDSVLAFLK